ncbi:serine protease [Nocardia sp. XZ_19_385]|uniref:trypsin-like peptidase domain-containing protein n=1 Tax=Nocardia sp. XZ_19_385 TaxID=2769488 RepID=UPI00188E3A22|nr:serine protease [Nocardia sp. XZ_19_385]
MPDSGIDGFLLDATAIVYEDARATRAIGTAFRVAPEYVVTAGHVADAVDTRCFLGFGADLDAASARVVARFSGPRSGRGDWSFDDLAVLRLEEPDRVAAPCVLLAEPVMTLGDELIACAMNGIFQEEFLEIYRAPEARAPGEPHAGYRVRHVHEGGWFTIDGHRAVVPGMSGGPVYSVRHGGVAGFMKGSENRDATGGVVVLLLDGLRRLCDRELYEDLVVSHDAYHRPGGDSSWSDHLTGRDAVVRRWLVRILGVLARLPRGQAQDVPPGLVDLLFRDFLPPPADRFVVLRDLAEYLGTQSTNPAYDLARFCVLTAQNIAPQPDSGIAEELCTLAEQMLPPRQRAGFRHQFPCAGAVQPATTTVFGVIRAEEVPWVGAEPPPFRFELFRKYGDHDIDPYQVSEPCPDYGQAKAALKAELDTLLRATSGAVELVIALPDNYLSEEPLHQWRRPRDGRPFSRFVMRLRRSNTWEKDAEQSAELEQRFRRLRARAEQGLLWLECADPRSMDLPGLQDLFADPEPAALDGIAVVEPPSAEVLTAAQSNALPVTLWRIDRCAAHPTGIDCPGTEFREALLERMHGVPPEEWHPLIWREQRSSAISDARDRLWRRIICIFDKPGESVRSYPLSGPEPTRRDAV